MYSNYLNHFGYKSSVEMDNINESKCEQIITQLELNQQNGHNLLFQMAAFYSLMSRCINHLVNPNRIWRGFSLFQLGQIFISFIHTFKVQQGAMHWQVSSTPFGLLFHLPLYIYTIYTIYTRMTALKPWQNKKDQTFVRMIV